MCFPPILLALLVVTLLGPGAGTLILVLSVLYTAGLRARRPTARCCRRAATTMSRPCARSAPRTGRILLRTILPNIAGPVLVQFSLAVAAAMVVESGLSFLGLGVVPPAPSWGLMIRGARATMEQAPLLLLWPCAALTLTILAMNMLCDALRDAVDPRTARRAAAAARLIDRAAAWPSAARRSSRAPPCSTCAA